MKRDGRDEAAVPLESCSSGPDGWMVPYSEADQREAVEWRERLKAAEERYRDALRDAKSDPERMRAILYTISGEVGPVPEMLNITMAAMTPLIAALVRIDEEKKNGVFRPAPQEPAGIVRRGGFWICSGCGRGNRGNFCSECGAKRP